MFSALSAYPECLLFPRRRPWFQQRHQLNITSFEYAGQFRLESRTPRQRRDGSSSTRSL